MTDIKLSHYIVGSLCTIKKLNLKVSKSSAVSNLVRPVEGAFKTWESTALHQVGQHYHHSHLILPNHAPKSWTCLFSRTLGSNIFPWIACKLVWDERGVDVITWLSVTVHLIRLNWDPIGVKGDNVLVPVPSAIGRHLCNLSSSLDCIAGQSLKSLELTREWLIVPHVILYDLSQLGGPHRQLVSLLAV